MMRPLSILCMLLAIGSGLYLYRTKYRAQMLDREITATLRSADEARNRHGLRRVSLLLLTDLVLRGGPGVAAARCVTRPRRPRPKVVSLTEAAAARVRDIMGRAEKPYAGLRVGV